MAAVSQGAMYLITNPQNGEFSAEDQLGFNNQLRFDCDQTVSCSSCEGLGWYLGGRAARTIDGRFNSDSKWQVRPGYSCSNGAPCSREYVYSDAYNVMMKTYQELPPHGSLQITAEIASFNQIQENDNEILRFHIDGAE